MKIPKSFTLGGTKWEVGDMELVKEYGVCIFDSHRILIARDMTKDRTEHTFCHELLHSVFYSLGLRDHDEKLIDGAATMLHQYFKQNHK